MHYGCKSVARRHVDVGSVAHILNNVAKIDQVGRIKIARNGGIVCGKYSVVAGGADESVVVFCEVIDTEFLVIAERQLTDHRAQRDLRRLDVHLVQNLFHLHHNLPISEDDDGIGALIGNELGVPDRDRLRRGVYRLGGELLGNIQGAAVPPPVPDCQIGMNMGLFRQCCRGRLLVAVVAAVADSRQAARHRAQRQRLQCPARQRLNQHRQNVTGGNVLQITRDWFCKLNVGIKLVNQFPNERHVDWARHDVDTIGAHVGSEFDFTHDDRFLGQRRSIRHLQPAAVVEPLRDTVDTADTRLSGRFGALFENVLEHVGDFARVGALELDKLTHHFRRRHIHLVNHAGKLPDDVGVLRHQKSGCFRQGENIDRARASLKICHQHLLKFLGIRILQMEQEADHRISRRDIRQIGNDWHRRFPRILARSDNVQQVAASRNERDSVQGHTHLDDLDGFLARHVFGDENVHLPLHEIIHHQLLAGELLVEMQHIDDIAVRELKPNHSRRVWRREAQALLPGGGFASWEAGVVRDEPVCSEPKLAVALASTERRDAEKAVHGLI